MRNPGIADCEPLTRGTRCTWLSRDEARDPEACVSRPTEPWRMVTSLCGVNVPWGDNIMPASRHH